MHKYDALIKNGTWKFMEPPFDPNPIGCKWVNKNKYKIDGSLKKYRNSHGKRNFKRNKLFITRHFFPYQNGPPSILYFP